MKKILFKVKKAVTSERALNFAKETIKETVTDSISTAGIYIIATIITVVIGIGFLLYLISNLF